MYEYGGGLWKEWNDRLKDALMATQRTSVSPTTPICARGSWDPIDEWSVTGGRVYTTALGALTLEIEHISRRDRDR